METKNLTATWNGNRRKPVAWQMLDVKGTSIKKGRYGRVSGAQMWDAHRFIAFVTTIDNQRQ